MKILVLTPGIFDKGGIARYGRFQITALKDKFGQDNVKVLSLMGRQIGDLEDPYEVSWCGPVPLTKVSRIYFANVAIHYMLKERPTILLSQLINFGPLAWSLARIGRAQLVQNIYGHELWSGLSFLRKKALKHSDLVISDCYNSADYSVTNELTTTSPIVIWDCVDIERYTPGIPNDITIAKYGITPSNRFRILFLGRLHKSTRYKGTERLLHLATKLPQKQFEIVMAGKGDDIEYLKALCQKLNIQKTVIFTGPIDECHMPDIYRSADAFYLVSEVGYGKGEGIPLTPIEAMACGIPVVVGNQDGSRELIDNGGGWCGEPHKLEQQVAYFLKLQKDKEFYQQERQKARCRAETAFGYQTFATKTEIVLKSLLKVDDGNK